MIKRIFKVYGWFGTAATVLGVVGKIYDELKKDSDELEQEEQAKKRRVKTKINKPRKKKV